MWWNYLQILFRRLKFISGAGFTVEQSWDKWIKWTAYG